MHNNTLTGWDVDILIPYRAYFSRVQNLTNDRKKCFHGD